MLMLLGLLPESIMERWRERELGRGGGRGSRDGDETTEDREK